MRNKARYLLVINYAMAIAVCLWALFGELMRAKWLESRARQAVTQHCVKAGLLVTGIQSARFTPGTWTVVLTNGSRDEWYFGSPPAPLATYEIGLSKDGRSRWVKVH